MFNESQTAYMRLHGLSEAAIRNGSADPAHRLEVANREGNADPVVAPEVAPPTAAQRDYLSSRKPEELADPRDLANYESLGGPIHQPKVETPVAKEAASLDGPIDWRTAKLDHAKMWSELPPTERLATVDALNRIQKHGVANSRESDVLKATAWLARA